MEAKEIFLSNLKGLMKDKELSFEVLSELVQINPKTMRRWSYDTSPNVSSIIKIADYFNYPIDYLLGLSPNPERATCMHFSDFLSRYKLLLQLNHLKDANVAKLCKISSSTVCSGLN